MTGRAEQRGGPADEVASGPAVPHPVTAGIVLGLAVGVFGLSFGVLAVSSGLTVAQASAMSLLVFTGASQFAAVAVVGAGGSTPAALGGALLLAARNGAYALAVSDLLDHPRPLRWLAAQFVIDESTAMATAQPDAESGRRAFWVTGLAVFVCWNVGTLLGALGGDAVGDPARYGLDAAFPAGFVALLVPHVRTIDGRLAAVIGATVALLAVPVAPAGVPVLLASVAVLIGLRRTPGSDADRGTGGLQPDGRVP